MVQLVFGTKNQISFSTESDFFETLGFLAKSDGTTSLVLEPNQNSGAWGEEWRIRCYKNIPNFPNALSSAFTKGVGNILHRINCNEYVEYIVSNYGFVEGERQGLTTIKSHIPTQYLSDFSRGFSM